MTFIRYIPSAGPLWVATFPGFELIDFTTTFWLGSSQFTGGEIDFDMVSGVLIITVKSGVAAGRGGSSL